MNYRVLAADDHPLSRRAIRVMLEGEQGFEWIGEAKDGAEAVAMCGELQPDVVLMDLKMPSMSGLEATRKIKQLYPHIRVIMLTVSDDVTDLFTAISCGAQGYLLKNMDPADWMGYLKGVLDEDSEVLRNMADRLLHSFQAAGSSTEQEVPPDVLTSRESEIVAHVANGRSNRQIAEELMITENTVKNHLKNILAKLSLDNRVQLTAYAVRRGLTHLGHKSTHK